MLQAVPPLEDFPTYGDIVFRNMLFEERSSMLPLVDVEDSAADAAPDQVRVASLTDGAW